MFGNLHNEKLSTNFAAVKDDTNVSRRASGQVAQSHIGLFLCPNYTYRRLPFA